MVFRISVFQVQKDVDAWKSVVAPLELVSQMFSFFFFQEISLTKIGLFQQMSVPWRIGGCIVSEHRKNVKTFYVQG